MIKATCLILSVVILSLGSGRVLAQNEPADSLELSVAGKNAKTDDLFFNGIIAKRRNDSKLAKELLEEFVQKRPNSSAAYYELAKLYVKDKNAEKADVYIRKALALDTANKWYKEQFATMQADKGAYLEAGNIMAQLSAADPRDRTYPVMAAAYYQSAKKYDLAIVYIDKAIAQVGSDEELMGRKLQIYLDMNDVEKAAGVIRQLITNDTRNGKYYKLLGDLYDNNKMPQKAAEVFEQAQKLLPGNADVEFGMASHFLKVGDTASYLTYIKKVVVNKELDADTQLELLKAYLSSIPSNDSALKAQAPVIRQVVNQHPGNADVQAFFGYYFSVTNQVDSATEQYKKAIAIKPSNFTVWTALLENYVYANNGDSLLRYTEKAMRLFPNQATVHYYNGLAHNTKKNYPAAIKAINRAIDMQPESEKQTLASMYSSLGEVYYYTKQTDLMEKAYTKALEITPNNASVLNNYSYFLSERGVKLDEAEKMSKKSLELQPGEGTYMDTYGWILYKKGNYEKAREYVQKAIDLAGGKADATLYDHLGNIYFKLGASDKAIENWKISKQKGNDSPLIDKKISEVKLYE